MKLNSVIAINAMEAIHGTHATLTDVAASLRAFGIEDIDDSDLADDLDQRERDTIVSSVNTLLDDGVMTKLRNVFDRTFGDRTIASVAHQPFVRLLRMATRAGGDEDLRHEYVITVGVVRDQLKVENWQTALSLALLPSILSMGGLKEYAIARALICRKDILFDERDLAIYYYKRHDKGEYCLGLTKSVATDLASICQWISNDADKSDE